MFRSTDVKTVPLIFIVDNLNIGETVDKQNNPVFFSPSKCSVDLPSTYKDVVSIELIQASFTIPFNNDYITLNVNNYSRTLGNATHLNSSFCTIMNDYSVAAGNKAIYKRSGSQPDESYIYYFSEPAKLSRLNIEMLDNTGAALADGRHILIFEIRALAQKRF